MIDHILYKEGGDVNVSRGVVVPIEPPLSDHHPVWARITFAFDPDAPAAQSYDADCSLTD